MPAIQPARLKMQAAELADQFNQPAVFIRQLHQLLDLYTDHTHRSGQGDEPSNLLGSYKTPGPIMSQVWVELNRVVRQKPEAVLLLCDTLWVEPNVNIKLLAARLLGQLPIDYSSQVMERLRSWVSACSDKRLLKVFLEYSLARLQNEAPAQLLELISDWLASENLTAQEAGLHALVSMTDQERGAQLPAIYALLTPMARIAPTHLRPAILNVFSCLIQVYPSETAYFLRQNLTAPDNPDTPWLIRQLLDEFPPGIQSSLRLALKSKRKL